MRGVEERHKKGERGVRKSKEGRTGRDGMETEKELEQKQMRIRGAG